jgi:hypothetical protein
MAWAAKILSKLDGSKPEMGNTVNSDPLKKSFFLFFEPFPAPLSLSF